MKESEDSRTAGIVVHTRTGSIANSQNAKHCRVTSGTTRKAELFSRPRHQRGCRPASTPEVLMVKSRAHRSKVCYACSMQVDMEAGWVVQACHHTHTRTVTRKSPVQVGTVEASRVRPIASPPSTVGQSTYKPTTCCNCLAGQRKCLLDQVLSFTQRNPYLLRTRHAGYGSTRI